MGDGVQTVIGFALIIGVLFGLALRLCKRDDFYGWMKKDKE